MRYECMHTYDINTKNIKSNRSEITYEVFNSKIKAKRNNEKELSNFIMSCLI